MIAHLLDGAEPGREGVERLVARALALREGAAPRTFPGRVLAAVLFNPSLRTRTSLEAACAALQVHPIVLHPGSDAWGWAFDDGAVMDGPEAEHVREAVPVLASYADVLAVRSFARLRDRDEDRRDPVLAAFAALSGKPVVNLESARWHPLQGLADAATWVRHLGQAAGRRLTLTWAPHPRALPAAVPNQVVGTAALLGMHVTVAHPEGFDLDPEVLDLARARAAASGGSLRVTRDRGEALAGADVVYAKSWAGWAGYADRPAEDRRRAALAAWRVDAVPEGAGFMHCLPVRRNVVVADGVLDGPRSWVQHQAALRRWTTLALLEDVLGGPGWR